MNGGRAGDGDTSVGGNAIAGDICSGVAFGTAGGADAAPFIIEGGAFGPQLGDACGGKAGGMA